MMECCPYEGQLSFSAIEAVIWPDLIGRKFPEDSPHSVPTAAASHQAQNWIYATYEDKY